MREWFKSGKKQNVAILCGKPSGNLVVLDFDDPTVYPRFFDVKEIQKKTPVVRTGSGKYHVYLRSDKPIQSFSIRSLNLEIRSDRNIVIAPPSKHPTGNLYESVNPTVRKILRIPDLENEIWEKAAKLGVKKPQPLLELDTDTPKVEPYRGPDPQCIQKLLQGVKKGLRNEAGIRIASYKLNSKREKPDHVWNKLRKWNQKNKPPMEKAELRTIFGSALKGEYEFSCSDHILKDYCSNELMCQFAKRKSATPNECWELEDCKVQIVYESPFQSIHPAIGSILDKTDQKRVAYVGAWMPAKRIHKTGKKRITPTEELCVVLSDKRLLLAEEKVLNDQAMILSYKPIKAPNRWSLPGIRDFLHETEVKVNPSEIYKAIKQKLMEYIELPDQRHYDLLTIWIIGTYFHHFFNSYPYLHIHGVKKSGKTKVLTIASCLAFNAILSNNMSPSTIFRLIQNAKSTLLIDETEKLNDPKRAQEFRCILLSGYKPGPLVYRTERNVKDRNVPQGFEVYAPKMLANIRGLDDVLEDRCITITIEKRQRTERSRTGKST